LGINQCKDIYSDEKGVFMDKNIFTQAQKLFLHDFHTVIDQARIMKLEEFIKLFKDIKNVYDEIEFLLKHCYLFFEEEHLYGLEKEARYELINPDLEVKRRHIHLFLPKELYRRIKLIHQDLNYFSMAQIVRFVIDRFIKIADEYGDGLFDHIQKLQEKWDAIKSKLQKQSKTLIVRQLSRFREKNNVKIELITLYTEMFSPFEILVC